MIDTHKENPFCFSGASTSRGSGGETCCGNPLTELIIFCSEGFCGDTEDDVNINKVDIDEVRSERTKLPRGSILRNPGSYDCDDERMGLVDPTMLYEAEVKAAANLDQDDTVSCASTISSAKSVGSHGKPQQVRVSFDPRLAPSPLRVPSMIVRTDKKSTIGRRHVPDGRMGEDVIPSLHTAFSEGDEGSDTAGGRSEKSARFDDALNTLIEYEPETIYKSATFHGDSESHRQRRQGEMLGMPSSSSSSSTRGKRNNHKHRSRRSRNRSDDADNMEILDGHRFDYRVIGTSIHDQSTKPNVLTIGTMDALQDYLPYTKRGELFWLKYSLVRDGTSTSTMLSKIGRSDYTILAVETLDGEVFGAFTSRPWQITWTYYGTPESFLWRLKRRRSERMESRAAEALRETDLEVFPFAGNNNNVQICNTTRLAVGGGIPSDAESIKSSLAHVKLNEWGFGLAFGADLQEGASSPCITFDSPSLSKLHADGSIFQVSNFEIWTLTPCATLADAEKMEAGKIMIERSMTI